MDEFTSALERLTALRTELSEAEKDFERARSNISAAEIRIAGVRSDLSNFETILRAAIPPKAELTADEKRALVSDEENSSRAADTDATDSEGRLL